MCQHIWLPQMFVYATWLQRPTLKQTPPNFANPLFYWNCNPHILLESSPHNIIQQWISFHRNYIFRLMLNLWYFSSMRYSKKGISILWNVGNFQHRFLKKYLGVPILIHMKMLRAKYQAISTNIVASIFISSSFWKHFFSKFTPKISDFAPQISKNDNSSCKTSWESTAYHLWNIHAKF